MPTERLKQLLGLSAESPNDSFLQFAIAKEHEKLGHHEDALHYYLHLIEKDPHYVGTYYHLGKLYEKLQEAGNAWDIYEKGIEMAREAGDQHALGELMGAKMALEEL
ncbi:MAG: tetratricopeptide repeat protein [Phaeodactylibacter sp.]|nr:tetratricopeptide repeat protein [Phaeodactylibacter sp.]MCB9274255.1 tetratricopeptide repeat protein [Lewinellaceae bacterium]